jgi:hypothetical protein
VKTSNLTANIVPDSLIISALMMDMIGSSETSVLTRAAGRHFPEYGILHYVVQFFCHFP